MDPSNTWLGRMMTEACIIYMIPMTDQRDRMPLTVRADSFAGRTIVRAVMEIWMLTPRKLGPISCLHSSVTRALDSVSSSGSFSNRIESLALACILLFLMFSKFQLQLVPIMVNKPASWVFPTKSSTDVSDSTMLRRIAIPPTSPILPQLTWTSFLFLFLPAFNSFGSNATSFSHASRGTRGSTKPRLYKEITFNIVNARIKSVNISHSLSIVHHNQ